MKNQPGAMFRYSPWDAFPALCGVGIVALMAFLDFVVGTGAGVAGDRFLVLVEPPVHLA